METKKLIDCCNLFLMATIYHHLKVIVAFLLLQYLILRDKTNFLLKTQCLCLKVTITD